MNKELLDRINEVLGLINVSAKMKDEESDELVYSSLDSSEETLEHRGNNVFKKQDGTFFRLCVESTGDDDLGYSIILEVGKNGGKHILSAYLDKNNELASFDIKINSKQVKAEVQVTNDKSPRDDCHIMCMLQFCGDNHVPITRSINYTKAKTNGVSFSNVIETYGVSANHDNDNIIHATSKKEEEKEKTWAEMIDESTDKKVYGTFNPNYIELIIHGKRNDYKRYEETADPTEEVINLLNHPRANETIMATEKIIESFFPNTMRFIREKVLPRYDNITRRGYSTNDVFDIYVDRFKRSMCDIPDHDVLVKNLSVS